MKSVVFALVLFHALAAMATQPSLQRPFRKAETKEFRQKLKDVVPAIENLMGIGGTAGMSIGVMSHGEVVLDQSLGFADVERQLRADASTRYPLASLTKAFFAATVSQLVDEGLLQWDQPLNTYIPELAFDSDPTSFHIRPVCSD
jgi:CubicO group peptidase (beta-lactamase class C family)